VLDWIESVGQGLSDLVNSYLGPAASFLEEYVWAWPEKAPLLAIVLLGTGLFVTVRLGFIQVRGFRHAINITRGKYDNPDDAGDLNHFQALTTALSATVGIGNIAGVAIGIRMGGPGALFWMWLTAFFGMALKYAECTLAVRYRRVNPDGSVSGGPMYYIEKGLGPRWKWMAMIFAACAAISSFGSGNMNQSNTLATRLETLTGIPTIYSALVFAALVALVIIGGIRRIGRVTSILAPGMAILYVAGAMIILAMHLEQIPGALATIVREAFAPGPLAGGAMGSLLITVMWGIRRGLFSNEAGQGSAPIAHATAKTDEPVREGLVASLEPFIDTLVICTMTGLVIVLTGVWQEKVPQTLGLGDVTMVQVEAADDETLIRYVEDGLPPAAGEVVARDGTTPGATILAYGQVVEGARLVGADGKPWSGSLFLKDDGDEIGVLPGTEEPMVEGRAVVTGADLTAMGFRNSLGAFGDWIVTLAVVLFAVSTGISWSYYGDRATEYLFGSQAIPIYRWVFVAFFFLGAILPLRSVWTWGDVALGTMSFPNLIALILLSGNVAMMTREYFSRKHVPYEKR
jgi:AGCS family alanine or glycine:cation symporter